MPRCEIEVERPPVGDPDRDRMSEIRCRVGGKVAGRVDVMGTKESGREIMGVTIIGVQSEFRRQGIGTQLYEAAARVACEQFGLPLASDKSHQRSPAAEAFWKKQARKKRAVCIGDSGGKKCRRWVLSCPAPASLDAAPEAEVAIRAIEREIATKATERAYVFDPDGKLVFKKIGRGKASIKFDEDDVKFFPDRILTHNHPPTTFAERRGEDYVWYKSGASLSPKDAFVAAKRNMAEVRAVTQVSVNGKPVTIVYRLERPPDGWPPPWKLEDDANAVSQRVMHHLVAEQRAGRRTREDIATAVMHETSHPGLEPPCSQ